MSRWMIEPPALPWLAHAGGMVLAVTLLSGCAGTPPPAAETSLTRQPEEPQFAGTLDQAQKSEIAAAFGSIAEHFASTDRLGIAENGRWSDVYSAVLYACDDVEMAIVAKRRTVLDGGDGTSERWDFKLRSVEDWPATLTVERLNKPLDDGTIYRASASVGHFDDRTDRAQALLVAFDRQLLAFGRKQRLLDE